MPGAKSPEGQPWIAGRKNKKADLRRPFYCMKTSELLLHRFSRSGSRCGRSSRSFSRCSSRSSGRCSSFSSLLAAGGQSKCQQGSNKSGMFHFMFLGKLTLKNGKFYLALNASTITKWSTQNQGRAFYQLYIGSPADIRLACYNPSRVEDMA